MGTSDKDEVKKFTIPARIAYAQGLSKPQPPKGKPDGEPKYTVTLLVDEKLQQHENWKAFEAEVDRNIALFGRKPPPGLKVPLRDGEEDGKADKPGYGPGVTWFYASAGKRPVPVVNKDRTPIALEEINSVIKSGYYVHAVVKVRSYGVTKAERDGRTNGGCGVTIDLCGVRFWKAGEQLGGAMTNATDEDWGKLEMDGDDVDDLLD